MKFMLVGGAVISVDIGSESDITDITDEELLDQNLVLIIVAVIASTVTMVSVSLSCIIVIIVCRNYRGIAIHRPLLSALLLIYFVGCKVSTISGSNIASQGEVNLLSKNAICFKTIS